MFFFISLIVIIAFIGLALIASVLMQAGKGGGLAGIGGGGAAGAAQQILGARQAPDILEKATWTMATLFIVLAIMTNFAIPQEEAGSVIQQRGDAVPQQQMPAPLEQQDEAAPLTPPDDGEPQ